MPTVRLPARLLPIPAGSAALHARRPRCGILPGPDAISIFVSRKMILRVLRIKVGVSIAVIDLQVEISVFFLKLRCLLAVLRHFVDLYAGGKLPLVVEEDS